MWPFLLDWDENRAPKRDGMARMSLWQGLVLSLFFHAALLSIPMTPGVKPVPTFEELQLVMETGADLYNEGPRGPTSEDHMVSKASAPDSMGQTGMDEASAHRVQPEFENVGNLLQTQPMEDMTPEVEENPSTTALAQESKPNQRPGGKSSRYHPKHHHQELLRQTVKERLPPTILCIIRSQRLRQGNPRARLPQRAPAGTGSLRLPHPPPVQAKPGALGLLSRPLERVKGQVSEEGSCQHIPGARGNSGKREPCSSACRLTKREPYCEWKCLKKPVSDSMRRQCTL